MKISLISMFLAGIVCVAASPGQPVAHEPARQPFSITISSTQGTVKAGEDVRVKITVTNTTDQPITLEETNHVCDYVVEVRDETGKVVPDTQFKRQHGCITHPSASARNMLVPLQPGESYEVAICVSELSDMTQPGQYSVQIQRKDSGEPVSSVVKSNVITITVTPKPEDAEPK